MALRKLIVGGNWKSNNTLAQTKDIISKVYNKLQFDQNKVEVVCSPVFPHLLWVKDNVNKIVQVSAQNISATKYGAYTGEVTAAHIKDMGIAWAIIGHSERRQYYHESSELVASKTKLAIESGLKVMACVGEMLKEREAGKTMKVIEEQMNPLKKMLSSKDWDSVAIAYEPVWAIGTGKVASPEQAQEVHDFIRQYLSGISSSVAEKTRIMYGGSVTEKNSDDLIKKKDIDGFLVGGASLKSGFIDIVNSCNKAKK